MSSYFTLTELIQKVHQRISLVPGTSVQIYGEGHTAELLQRTFDALAREPSFWWPWLMEWQENVSLDGTTGTPTQDLNADASKPRVRSDDVRYIWRVGETRPIPYVPSDFNPFTASFGRTFYEYSTDMKKVWRIWPRTDTGTYYVRYRKLPAIFEPDSLVPFDPDVLIEKTAWRLATNDGANPAQGMLFLNEFEANWQRVKLAYSDVPVMLDPRLASVNDRWQDDPLR